MSHQLVVFCILAALIFLIYSNSFQASWHFDDYENVTSNVRVQIRDLGPETLIKTFFASPEGKQHPFRSAAYFTFALNAYFGGTDVFGYHVVNVTVHLLTAFFLFLCVLTLFDTPRLERDSHPDAMFIAFLTAILWAANPIQTQAVTYIVQRMAAMAAMFTIIGIYCFLAARLTASSRRRIVMMTGCGLSYFLAVMSKENAAIFPLSLLFLEFIFFRDCRKPREVKMLILLLAAGTAAVIALGAILFGNPFGFLNGYPNRTFTPFQRLLTEARIVVHYLSQIFYPVPTRLSLYHDVALSHSLLQPWTTLPSVLAILALIGVGLKWMATRPLLSFAILFFLVSHLIESTVIGLELVFEHRNYLPSLFIFMPVAVGVEWLTNHYQWNSFVMRRVLIAGTALLIIGYGAGTFVRNQAWANEKTLWEDTLAKAPNSIRAHHELAYQYYEKIGNYDAALYLYHRGLDRSGQNVYEKTLSLNNIASIHFTRGEYNRAAEYWKKAIDSYPKYSQAYYRLALTQTWMGEWDAAAETLAAIDDRKPIGSKRLRLKGVILLHDNKPDIAKGYFHRSIKMTPRDWQSVMFFGVASSMTGEVDEGLRLLQTAESIKPDPLVLLMLAINRLVVGDNSGVESHLDRFITRVGAHQVAKYLERVTKRHEFENFSLKDIQPLIEKKIGSTAGMLHRVTHTGQGLPVGREDAIGSDESQSVSRSDEP